MYLQQVFAFLQMSQAQMDWQVHKTNLGDRFKELYTNNQWTDCAFKVGDNKTEVR